MPIQQPSKKVMWFVLALLVLIADQASKSIASAVLQLAEPVAFVPYFNFTLLHNEGAAFGFLANAGGWQRVFLGAIAGLMSLLLIVWILCVSTEKKIEITGLSLILGGAVGNLWDRIFLGHVVDFIDWFYPATTNTCLPFFYTIFLSPSTQNCHWPAFNIADAAIMLGVTLLIIDMLFCSKHNTP